MTDTPTPAGDGVAGELREAFSGKRGKILILAGVVVVGYLYWTRARTGGGTDPAATDAAAAAWDAGAAAGTAGATGTPPTVGNDVQTPGVTSRPQTNDQWLSRAVDLLGAGAFTALRKALDGQPLTQAESDLVSRAITAFGVPPEGMPALQLSSPATTGKTVVLTAPTGLHVTATTKTTVSLAWSKVAGAGYYRVYRQGVSGNVGAADGTAITVGGLKAGTKYAFAVAADTTTASPGPKSAYVTATTKS